MIDAKLTYDSSTNDFDISFANGDIETVQSFDTSLIVSLCTDARADATEVQRPEYQRGWWGDTVDSFGVNIGSKRWLLSQARLLNNLVSRINDYNRLALQWLVSNNYSQRIVTSSAIENGGLSFSIQIFNKDSKTQSESYKYWIATGNFINGS